MCCVSGCGGVRLVCSVGVLFLVSGIPSFGFRVSSC